MTQVAVLALLGHRGLGTVQAIAIKLIATNHLWHWLGPVVLSGLSIFLS
jgi:hypothetical protein